MRISAILLVLAFLLAEGVALIPGPCCLNALLGSQGDDPVACSHGSGAHPEGCCGTAELVTAPCCCSQGRGPSPAMKEAPPSCRCRFQESPDTDKDVESVWDDVRFLSAGILPEAPRPTPPSADPRSPEGKTGADPPDRPLLLLHLSLLL